jgi:hypothetical protein
MVPIVLSLKPYLQTKGDKAVGYSTGPFDEGCENV